MDSPFQFIAKFSPKVAAAAPAPKAPTTCLPSLVRFPAFDDFEEEKFRESRWVDDIAMAFLCNPRRADLRMAAAVVAAAADAAVALMAESTLSVEI